MISAKQHSIKDIIKKYDGYDYDTKFFFYVIELYTDKYFKTMKFLNTISFNINYEIFVNDVTKIKYKHNQRFGTTDFILIGSKISNSLYWYNDFNKILYNKIKNEHPVIFRKFKLSNTFIDNLFNCQQIRIKKKEIIFFYLCLINMFYKGYKVIDFTDNDTKITILGLVKIKYYDNFNIYKDFLNHV